MPVELAARTSRMMNLLPSHVEVDASLRIYSEFIRNLPVALYRITVEGRVVFCNDAFARLFGFDTVDEVINYPVIRLYRHKKDRGALVRAVLEHGSIVDMALPLQRQDGSAIWCAVTSKAVFDDDGEAIFLDGGVRDITGQIQEADPSLPPSAERADHQGAAVFVFDTQGTILDASEAAARLLGEGSLEVAGRPFAEWLGRSAQNHFLLFVSDVFKIGQEAVTLPITSSTGDYRCLQLDAVLARLDGHPNHIKASAWDVTDKVQQLKEKANIDKFQGVLEMAGGVAHRLNQPLTIVTNILNELQTQWPEEGVLRGGIAKAYEQVMKMNAITHKIGNIKKYEAVDYVAGIKIVDIDRAS
jgi:PAS domain S-box-containing protein